MSKHANEGNLTGLLEELDREIEGDISLGDILEHFNSRGFGPLLVLPALLVLLDQPTSNYQILEILKD